MTPYIIVFLFSVLCIHLAQRSGKNVVAYTVFILLAILLPSLLAGFRDSTVGTDVLTYVDNIWDDILHTNSISDMIGKNEVNYYAAGDIGYLFLNYILSSINRNVHIIYWGISVFMLLFLYFTNRDNTQRISWALSFFLFFFLYYNLSLNMMRQMLVMSIGLYCYKYVERRQWLYVAASIIVMLLFHSTGITYLLVIALYIVYHSRSSKIRFALFGVGALALFMTFSYYDVILIGIVNSGILSSHYLMYEAKEGVFQTSMLIIYLVFFIVFLFSYRVIKDNEKKYEIGYYAIFHFFATLLSMLSIIMYDANRLAQYLLFISILLFLPRTLFLLKRNKHKYYFQLLSLTIVISVVGWYYVNIYMGSNETYPYKSVILGV